MTHPIPAEAITAAARALHAPILDNVNLDGWERTIATVALEAAWPHQIKAVRDQLVAATADEVTAVTQATVLEAVAASTERIAELEALAAEILASYGKTSDGYRSRVGGVQILKWAERVAGERG